MYVLSPRLNGAAAYIEGFSRGRGDDVMPGFRRWFSVTHPVKGGYANPVSYETVIAERLFGKRSQELSAHEERGAVAELCDLIRKYLDDQV